ncbi:NDP-sugar epimerase, includes UDP-GlcNAc-inverting 4,6-dehydratase FlaA1 and capsular polysaccharide biosynthesis protein EpsC [Loktanella fryxellensis]|uniref:NDP-sugar epimerase, includes UDP-GlcNAc-inverting 4,6-dehydratase FlaA1 and capsular polysaccharide biosynthesis protein EpsC n=1 Tax=Loktanella fryxellensis TaxID=245187 RepID=A0A1H8GVH2_9RHOB|nr:nucleoside-diphosphate sugar epimerase/dehydratase [Loktanella fryxellensis]SEN47714.1 NDP-sugar epimerase, includes UDP-GlcNAc-inverting 4,6-dehydratase FlaA1 and capsular polysaccharide biosynthesis protein EpsC [Loktanella fryxellensis]
MYRTISALSRRAKRVVLLAVDVVLIPAALLGAIALQGLPADGAGLGATIVGHWLALPLLMAIGGLLSSVLGLPLIQLKSYESHAVALTGLHAVLLGLAAAVLDDMAGFGTPLASFINFAIVYFLLAVAARMGMLQLLLGIYRRGQDQTRVLIYGAGATGRQLAAALRTDERIFPVAFVDDNVATQGTIVQGLTVYGPMAVEDLIRSHHIDRVLLAMPSASRPQQAQLSRRLEDLGVEVQAVPSFAQLTGRVPLLDQLQPVVPGRFLGREALDAALPDGGTTYAGRVILITGAGGSIGSELCRQLLGRNPAKLVLCEISELALYTIDMELRALLRRQQTDIVPVLGSITDAGLMARIMADHGVQVVLHAAAYKHVPLVESNPVVGMSNNVLGTQVLAQAAANARVERFILISSDKAVRPQNMMGASKRMAELVVQDLASRSAVTATGRRSVFTMVRFGNVMGSSGSVIPLFQDQIAKGGPVTLTHREVTRYFMTIPEAAKLVLVAGSFASGGDVFVLDMGEPMPIYDLARQMIAAAGYSVRDAADPDGDIEIRITGLRPGEKIHEELLIGEGQLTTPHPKILQANEAALSELEMASAIKALRRAIETADEVALRAVVARWVEGGAHFAQGVEGQS